MKDALILLFHLLTVFAKLLRPGGGRAPTPARLATPGRQIDRLWARFGLGIPIPLSGKNGATPGRSRARRRGAEFRVPRVFGF